MTDISMLIALAAADKAGEPDEVVEPTALAVLRVDRQLVVVSLPSVLTIMKVRLGDLCPPRWRLTGSQE